MPGSRAAPAAFDAVAAGYDQTFTHTGLGQMLRRRVWRVLARHVSTGQHLLELACGTGEDAVWLARQGVRVTAVDGSAEMLRVASKKAKNAGVADLIEFDQISLQQFSHLPSPISHLQFDGAFSNFGGLNTIDRWDGLAKSLSKIIKPGGVALLVPMGPICPWEIGWHLLHANGSAAFRRWRGPALARVGDAVISVWYPSARQLRRHFAPWFDPVSTESLGLWLPPSYLGHLVERWPGLFARLGNIEARTARLTAGWGDHYLSLFRHR